MEYTYTTIERLVIRCKPEELQQAYESVSSEYRWISQKPIWKGDEISRIKVTFEREHDTRHQESSAP